MNDTLAPVLRKCVLVFFDHILVYSKDYTSHLQHLQIVLQQLYDHQWQVKLSKCAFAQQEITNSWHTIIGRGFATDESNIIPLKT